MIFYLKKPFLSTLIRRISQLKNIYIFYEQPNENESYVQPSPVCFFTMSWSVATQRTCLESLSLSSVSCVSKYKWWLDRAAQLSAGVGEVTSLHALFNSEADSRSRPGAGEPGAPWMSAHDWIICPLLANAKKRLFSYLLVLSPPCTQGGEAEVELGEEGEKEDEEEEEAASWSMRTTCQFKKILFTLWFTKSEKRIQISTCHRLLLLHDLKDVVVVAFKYSEAAP